MFIAWCIAINPKSQFIHLSYADELATDNSARIKELIALQEYQELWPVQMNADRNAKSLWRTQQGGGLKAGPAGGIVMGFGADLGTCPRRASPLHAEVPAGQQHPDAALPVRR